MRFRYVFLAAALLTSGLRVQAQAALTKLGSVAIPSYGTEVAVSGTTAYVLTASTGQQNLRVYDVSTPATPQLLSTLALPTPAYAPSLPFRHAVLSNGTLYVSSFPTNLTTPHSVLVWAINVNNPASPSLIAQVQPAGGDELFLAASGDYFYTVFDNATTLYVYDRTQVSNGYFAAWRSVALPYSLSGITSLSLSGNTAYIQYTNGTFATLDLTTASTPVSSAGTLPGSLSAASGALGFGLAQPAYAGSVPSNTLRFYSLSTPLRPTLVSSQAGSYGTRLAAGGQSVFTVGATSPFLNAAASSSEPLRGYYVPTSGSAPVTAFDATTQGANALAVANNVAYILTDASFSIYAFPTTVTAAKAATALAPLPLYPNPAHGKLNLPKLAPGAPVTIYDVAGRSCLQALLPTSGTLDISALPAGLYQVRTGTSSSKLLVD